jgi:hypothetical protein
MALPIEFYSSSTWAKKQWRDIEEKDDDNKVALINLSARLPRPDSLLLLLLLNTEQKTELVVSLRRDSTVIDKMESHHASVGCEKQSSRTEIV